MNDGLVTFIGIDLAWSPRNLTGAAIIQGDATGGVLVQTDLLCAYIALYAFRWGEARCRVFGTLEEGSIFTPMPEEMLVQLRGMS